MNAYAQLLYAALDTKYGLVVSHHNRAHAAVAFDRERRKDPALKRLSITCPEDQPNWLMIVKCPDEKQNLLAALTSFSTTQTSNGSRPPTPTTSESPEQSE